MSGHHKGHDHDHTHPHPSGMGANLLAGDYNPVQRAFRIVVNIARRGRGGRPHSCCGNYGEPGC